MHVKHMWVALGLALGASGTAMADAHSITYARKTAALGETIMVVGFPYKIIRLPFRLFTGEKYSITVPVPLDIEGGSNAAVHTRHNTGAFQSNATVDSLPARITVDDVRTYSVSGDFNTVTLFETYTNATSTITIKIGASTLVIVDFNLPRFDPISGEFPEGSQDVGAAVNMVPYAQWAKYVDPVVQVKGINDLLDYIRITAL